MKIMASINMLEALFNTGANLRIKTKIIP